MKGRLRVLIAGDLFMKVERFEDALRRALSERELAFRTIEYPYPVDEFALTDYTMPSRTGGCWDEPSQDIGGGPADVEEVTEYYGDIDQLEGRITDVDVLIVHLAPVTRSVLTGAKNLKLIGCCRGGPKNVNVEAATERGVVVINAPGRTAVAVAEFTVGLLLAHTRYIARGHAHLRRQVWKVGAYRDPFAGPTLRGRTAGIVGLGHVGREIARILHGFEMDVVAYDPYVAKREFESSRVKRVPLERLLRTADFVILCARLTPETVGMINEQALAMMKASAHLVNTARGGLVDYDALLRALECKQLAGAALDVFDQEPPARQNPLIRLDNVTITPHIAGASRDVLGRTADTLAGDVRRFVQGQPLRHCLNPEVYQSIPPSAATAS